MYNESTPVHDRPAIIDRILTWLDHNHFEAAYPEARSWRAQAIAIRQTAARAIDLDGEHARLVEAVLAGIATVESAAADMESLASQNELRPDVERIAEAAAQAADYKAWRILGTDQLVTEHLRPVVEAAVARFRKAAPLPSGVVDDGSAVREGGAFVTKTWSVLTVAAEDVAVAWELYDVLLAGRVLGGLSWGSDLAVAEVRYRKPQALPRVPFVAYGNNPRAPHPVLALMHQLDAEPTVLTVIEAMTARAERQAAHTRALAGVTG